MRRLFVVGLVAAACLGLASTASADRYGWKLGWLAANARDASGSFPELRASAGIAQNSGRKIRAGAHLPGGWTLYANFAEGWGSACHSYAGTQSLGGLLENPHTVEQHVGGIIHYYAWEYAC